MKSINPDPEKFIKAISTMPKGVPIVMLNLLKFREIALYPDDSSEISGRDAYMRYGAEAMQLLSTNKTIIKKGIRRK